MGFHSCSSSSSAYFSKFKFELSNLNFSSSSLAKNIKFFEFKFRLTKILSLLFDLIALLLYTCCFFRLPRHKQMYDIFNLRGMINNQYYFFPTIFPSLNFFYELEHFFSSSNSNSSSEKLFRRVRSPIFYTNTYELTASL